MAQLSTLIDAKRISNRGILVKQVLEMLDFAEEFQHIHLYFQPSQEDMDFLNYIFLLHDDLLDYFIQVEDNDPTGEAKEKIKNFEFSVDSTEE